MERSAIEVCNNRETAARSAKKSQREVTDLKVSRVLLRVLDKRTWKERLGHGLVILAATEVVLWALLLYALSWVTEKQ
jgi:hypothetical protein